MGMKNDVSFIICDDINLYEHQSSYNPNMPLRGLMYFGKQYDKYLVSTGKRNDIYTRSLIKVPTPKFFVFYNGDKKIESRTVLKLSDAFMSESPGDIEVKATMININADSPDPILKKCKALHGYSEFNALIKMYRNEGCDLDKAVGKAIDECIRQNVLKDIFEVHKSEVIEVCLEEYNENEVMQAFFNEGHEEGRKLGHEEGEDKLAALTSVLLAAGRVEDLQKAAIDKDVRESLYKELSID